MMSIVAFKLIETFPEIKPHGYHEVPARFAF